VNLNETVEVTLTQAGFDRVIAPGSVNAEGAGTVYECQLWVLMRDFGPHMVMGGPQMFVKNEARLIR
jgi:hypothetical protein